MQLRKSKWCLATAGLWHVTKWQEREERDWKWGWVGDGTGGHQRCDRCSGETDSSARIGNIINLAQLQGVPRSGEGKLQAGVTEVLSDKKNMHSLRMCIYSKERICQLPEIRKLGHTHTTWTVLHPNEMCKLFTQIPVPCSSNKAISCFCCSPKHFKRHLNTQQISVPGPSSKLEVEPRNRGNPIPSDLRLGSS